MAHDSKRVKTLATKSIAPSSIRREEAMKLVKADATAKFDESVDVSINLGVDAEEIAIKRCAARWCCRKGTGKSKRVAVFAQGDKAKAPPMPGADIVGFEDLAERHQRRQDGFRRRDRHAGAMRVVGPLGQILGPRGYAEPESRDGNAGCRDGREERQSRPGAIPHRQGRHRAVHDRPRLFYRRGAEENLVALVDAMNKAKPAGVKGVYLKKVSVSSTMGIGVRVDQASLTLTDKNWD